MHLQQEDVDQANQLVNQIQMDKTKDLEEDANVNKSQFQEFLQFVHMSIHPNKKHENIVC